MAVIKFDILIKPSVIKSHNYNYGILLFSQQSVLLRLDWEDIVILSLLTQIPLICSQVLFVLVAAIINLSGPHRWRRRRDEMSSTIL